MKNVRLTLSAACVLLCATVTANASPYVVTLEQVGSNVVATGGGDIDLDGLVTSGGGGSGSSYMDPSGGYIDTGGGPIWQYQTNNSSFTGPTSFGSGGFSQANTQTGPTAGIYDPGTFADGFSLYVTVPYEYVSDTLISDLATYNSQTLASLGITPGTYTWTWGIDADQSFTLDVVAATPLPATLPLLLTGLGGLGLLGWRRKRNARPVAA
jgi:hypothetical protein